MSKIATGVVVLCAVLTTPVFGYWHYLGTEVSIAEPDSDSAPDGTWWYSWAGDGSVDAGPFHLYATGWVLGDCGVQLYPYYGDGLYASAYAMSWVSGASTYEWEEDGGDREIEVTVDFVIYPSRVSYYGHAIDDTHVSSVKSSAGTQGADQGGVEGVTFETALGWGSGWATTQVGSGASADVYGGVTIDDIYTDSWNPPPFLYNVGYEGELEFSLHPRQCRIRVNRRERCSLQRRM